MKFNLILIDLQRIFFCESIPLLTLDINNLHKSLQIYNFTFFDLLAFNQNLKQYNYQKKAFNWSVVKLLIFEQNYWISNNLIIFAVASCYCLRS